MACHVCGKIKLSPNRAAVEGGFDREVTDRAGNDDVMSGICNVLAEQTQSEFRRGGVYFTYVGEKRNLNVVY